MQNSTVKKLLGFIISIIFLIMALYQSDLQQIWKNLIQINYINIGLCIIFFGISCVFRAFAWRITTRPFMQVDLSTLFGGVVVGYLANNILPLRAGELVRAYYLTERTGIPRVTAFSTICIERIFDFFSLGLILVFGIVYGINGLMPNKATLALVSLISVILVLALLFILILRIGSARNVLNSNCLLSRFVYLVDRLFEPVLQLKQFKVALFLILLNLAAWASNYISLFFIINNSFNAGYEATLLLLLFVNLSFLIPSSPGALGVMQVAFWMALSPFGYSKEQSISLSFAYQIGLYVFTLGVGMPYFLSSHLQSDFLSRNIKK